MKKKGRNRTIAARLTTAFLAVALLTLTSAVISLWGFWGAARATRTLVDNTEMIRSVQEIRVSVGPLLEPPRAYVLTGDASAAGRYDGLLNQVETNIASYEREHRAHRHSTEHSLSAEALIGSTKDSIVQLALLGDAFFTTTNTGEALLLKEEMETLLSETNSRLNELLVNAEEDIRSARDAHAALQRNAYIGLSSSALLAFGLAVGLALVLTRSIGGPLQKLAQAADRISDGDLATPVSVEGSGEIGQLSDSFERMRLALVHERGQVRLLAVLEERDRIGREMHDGLAQVLGYVGAKAQAVGEYLKSDDMGGAECQLGELVGAAREAYTDAREVIVGLRLDGVQERGLAALAGEYVERFQRQSGVAAELVISPSWDNADLSDAAKVQLLRIIQEALTNVRKHARANQVRVRLESSDGLAQIQVDDDGRGFMLSSLLRPDFSRYGLRTMRERAQAVGGRLRIESTPDKGTRITATLPIGEDEDRLT